MKTESIGNMLPSDKVAFFVRSQNELDQFAPVVDRLVDDGRVRVILCLLDQTRSFKNDYRVRYLHGRPNFAMIPVNRIDGAGPAKRLGAWVRRQAYVTLVRLSRFKSPRLADIAARELKRQLKKCKAYVQNLDPEVLLSALFADGERGLVAFDHNAGDFARRLTEAARKRKLATVSLPHSLAHAAGVRDARPDELSQVGLGAGFNIFDAVAFPNTVVARRLISTGLQPRRVHVLGSARFSQEWVRRLRDLIPSMALPRPRPGRKKVLFLLSKRGPYVDWAEVLNLIGLMSRRREVQLLVQVHPRSEATGVPILFGQTFDIVKAGIPTPNLIDWADVILFWSSTVIYEALRLGKPIIHLRYVIRQEFDFETVMRGWTADSHDRFVALLDRALDGSGSTLYSAAEAVECLSTFVDAGRSDVCGGYAELIYGLVDESSCNQAEKI